MLRSLTHMHLGRRAQLTLVQMADDVSALQAALHFGRWIKLPALMLGEARINFKRAQDARKKEQQHNLRRMQLGIKVDPADLPPDEMATVQPTDRGLALESERDGGKGRGARSSLTDRSAPSGATTLRSHRPKASAPGSRPDARASTKKGLAKATSAAAEGEKKKEAERRRELDEAQRRRRREQEKARTDLVRATEHHRHRALDARRTRGLEKLEREQSALLGGEADLEAIREASQLEQTQRDALAIEAHRMLDKHSAHQQQQHLLSASRTAARSLLQRNAWPPHRASAPEPCAEEEEHAASPRGLRSPTHGRPRRGSPDAISSARWLERLSETRGTLSETGGALSETLGEFLEDEPLQYGPHTTTWLEMVHKSLATNGRLPGPPPSASPPRKRELKV